MVEVSVAEEDGIWRYDYSIANDTTLYVVQFGINFVGPAVQATSPSNWTFVLQDTQTGDRGVFWYANDESADAVAPGEYLSGFTVTSSREPGHVRYGALILESDLSIEAIEGTAVGPGDLTIGNEIPGDYNSDGAVSTQDLEVWARTYGGIGSADGNRDGLVDGEDFLIWQRNLGASAPAGNRSRSVPEPSAFMLICTATLMCCLNSQCCSGH